MTMEAILHTDGGSRGNPGPSGIGFELLTQGVLGPETLAEGGAFIGQATNNQAEYQALLWGLANAQALGVQRVVVRADSELMIKQLSGAYQVKNEGIRSLYEQAATALQAFTAGFELEHVYRNANVRADALANAAMDEEQEVGCPAVSYSPAESGAFAATYGTAESCDVPVSPSASSATTPSAPCAPAASVAAACLARATDPAVLQSLTATGPAATQLPTAVAQSLTVTDPAAVSKPASATGVYTLSIKDHFDAAHALVGYPGECKNLHGHTWDIEVSVSGTQLDEVGILYDFKALKANLGDILRHYDHVYLNEVPPFDRLNATAEHLARVIYEQLAAVLPCHVALDEVAVWESPIARLGYRLQGAQAFAQPGAQPGAQSSIQPSTQPSAQAGTQPSAQADTQLGTQPGTQPSAQAGTQPGTQPRESAI